MKTMTCDQLGGACKETFQAETFEEMAELSKQHGMAMFAAKMPLTWRRWSERRASCRTRTPCVTGSKANGASSTPCPRTEACPPGA